MSTLPAGTPRQSSGDGSASPALNTAALAREVRRLADRFRHLSESRLRGLISPDDPSDPGRSRADAGLELARALAALGDAPAGRKVPDLGVFAVGDQIAVTGLDLVAGLDGGRGRELPAASAAAPDTPAAAEAVLDEALRAVRELAALV
ncbi:hypothetical protein [Yinghuangia soli]|uniref:Uncharacterized protein n=1 Tax=Yinghuangia soli TaxID=2908204 RepID=A0AA41TYW8_9ACTN|nr:hypothetical protein [Yinghuangia soli]MCF2528223.1 hypothetical protein [Yinghuangia soli]